MASECCNAGTRIGYYNPATRPDIHGLVNQEGGIVAAMGCFCDKCGKLCDYYYQDTGEHFYTNGIIKQSKTK